MKRKLPAIIIALIFASALWAYVSLSSSYSLDLSVPVEVKTTKSQALSDELPSSIEMTVKGKGWDLLSMILSRDLRYTLDLTKVKRDSRVSTRQLISESMNLKQDLSLVTLNPDTISISFDRVLEKRVPVRSDIRINLREGYSIIGKPKLTPDSVTITGSANLVSRIRSVSTESKVFENVNSSVSGTIALKDTFPSSVKADVRSVDFRYNIQLSAEKSIEEVIVSINDVPDDKEVLLIPPKITVSIRGGVDQLARISPSDITAGVEFPDIESDTLGFVVPEINIPEETSLLSFEPQKLQYIIKKKL